MGTCRRQASAPPCTSAVMIAAYRPSRPLAARTSLSPPASCTPRTASSRWTCRAAWQPGSFRSCSARSPSVRTARRACSGSATWHAQCLRRRPPNSARCWTAYTRGVNSGLAGLSSRPWEYWLLGQRPAQWRTEDGILVVYAMWWDLQASGLRRGILRREVNERLGGAECADGWKCALRFFYPPGTQWDAPGGVGPGNAPAETAIPGPEVLNVRAGAVRRALRRDRSVSPWWAATTGRSAAR